MDTNKTIGGVDENGFAVNVPISTSQLQPVQPINIPTPVQDTTPFTTAMSTASNFINQSLAGAEQELKAAQGEGSALSNLMTQTQRQLGQRAGETANVYQERGVNDLAKQLRTLNAQAQALNLEAQAVPIQIQQESEGMGRTTRGVAPIQSARLRENALKALSLAQQSAIAQADYATAKDLADQQIALKYDALENELKVQQLQLNAIDKFKLTPAQEKAKEARQLTISREEKRLAQEREEKKALNDMLINANAQGAPRDIVERARQAKTSLEAASILGQYSGDYWGTKLKIAEFNKKQSEAAKIAAEVAAAGTGSASGVSSQDQAKFLLDSIAQAKNLSTASGRSLARRKTEEFLVGDTDYTNLEAKVRTVKNNLLTMATDPNIKKFFGPQMTESDVQNMMSTATTLDTAAQSPAELKAELERAEKIFKKFAPGYVPDVGVTETSKSWAEKIGQAVLSPNVGDNFGFIDNKK